MVDTPQLEGATVTPYVQSLETAVVTTRTVVSSLLQIHNDNILKLHYSTVNLPYEIMKESEA